MGCLISVLLVRCVLEGLLLVTFLVVSRPERKRRSPMQGYAPAAGETAFERSREYYAETEEWLASAEAGGLSGVLSAWAIGPAGSLSKAVTSVDSGPCTAAAS